MKFHSSLCQNLHNVDSVEFCRKDVEFYGEQDITFHDRALRPYNFRLYN
jgi:hypothetical protein